MSAAPTSPTSPTCRWPNCGREVLRHGFCARDLQRLRKQGLSTTEIPTLTAEDIQREYIAWTSNQPSPTIADSADPESAPRVASTAPERSPVDVLQPDPLVAALEERDLWQRREAAAVERARTAERELLGHLDAVRCALNVGPPSPSDVLPGTAPERIVEIVRSRSVQMLEERDQRVALGQLVERIAKSTGFATGPLLGQYGPLEEHIRGMAKEAERATQQEEWLADHLADSTPVLRALVADGCGFVEPLASVIAERAVPAGPGHELHEERLVVARLFAAHLLTDPMPF